MQPEDKRHSTDAVPECIICDVEARFLLNKNEYPHYLCPQCGLVFVWPIPSEQKLAKEVYSEESGYQADTKIVDGWLSLSRHVRKIIHFLKAEKLTSQQTDHLLDVGCSSGDFLVAARDAGFEVQGVELNPRTAMQAQSRGLVVKIGTLFDGGYPDGTFDVINLGDVIEHVTDPKALLRECKRILKTDGTLVVTTPNFDCLWSRATLSLYRAFNVPWSSATPPHHLFLFSCHNLDLLLRGAGFSPLHKWFERQRPLLYELSHLLLWSKFRRQRTINSAASLVLGFGLYVPLYAMNYLVGPLLNKNMGMTAIYKKHL